MKKIASHGEIDIFAPDKSGFSFLKSPYAAHKTHSAVDIYYGDFGSDALSPADGEVIDVRSFDTPTPFKDRDSKEYIIAIRQNEHVIKILHVKPDVLPGDTVTKGESIGTFIHNGYFIFWNDPVMHVEVRKQRDYLRASNNMKLTPNIEWSELPARKTLDLECRVEGMNKRYTLLCGPSRACGDVGGFAMDGGFLDGYIPCSDDGFFGFLKPGGFFHPPISLEITKDNSEIKCSGIAFRLSFLEPKIKLIPLKYGDRLFEPGEKVRIRLGVR
jgi:hypothetical protein